MRTNLKHICHLSIKRFTIWASHFINTLVIASFIFGSPLSRAGCAEDCPQSPCFRPTTIKDDNTPFAFDLCTVYEMARCHDSTLQAAKQAQLAVQESMPQATASFLPVISAQAAHTNAYNNGGSFFSPEGTVASKVGSYVSNVYTLALTQPILHFEHWQKFEQACDTIKQANATFAFAEQDLMIRTAQAYFGVLEAIDRLYFSTAQLKALKKFYDQTSERFKVGLIAITDVQIAKASHDSAVAQVINSRTAVSNQLEKLREIVGYRVEHLLPLKDEFTLPAPEPSDPEQWVAVSLKQNFELQAQRYKTLAAREDIKITETGHLPTVDLNGQIQRITPNNQVQFAGTVSQLSVQVNLPLFSGGSVISKTRQARHTFLQRDKETETLFRTVESNTRQYYLNVLTQISQVSAYKQAVISNKSALDATQASFNVGTRTIVDVLNAQTGMIQAQLNLATARYAYILQSFQLKRSAGILSPVDLCNINCWLKSTPADAIIKTGDITAAVSLSGKDTTLDDRDTSIEADKDNSIAAGVTADASGDVLIQNNHSLGADASKDAAAKLGNEPSTPTSTNLPIVMPVEGVGITNYPSDSGSLTTPTSTDSTTSVTPSSESGNTSGTAPLSPITYPGTSTSPVSDKFNTMPTPQDSKIPHAPPPPPTQTNPSSSPGASNQILKTTTHASSEGKANIGITTQVETKKNMKQDTNKETVKESPKETNKETVKESPKETNKETVKETPRETKKETKNNHQQVLNFLKEETQSIQNISSGVYSGKFTRLQLHTFESLS